ncbi:MAG: hypothetical protein BalsKO_10620 [Balneolaceae bacterium]
MKSAYLLSIFLLFASCSNNSTSVQDDNDLETLPFINPENLGNPLVEASPTSGFDYLIPTFSTFSYEGNNPNNVNRSYVNGVQGLANDGTNWYLSNKENIYKWNGSAGFPSSISGTSNYDYVGMVNVNGGGYDHYGDIDFDEDQNLLYVPLERSNKSKAPLLVVFDENLNFIDYEILSKNNLATKEAPWVSIDPISKKIYTSKFNNVSELWIYTDSNSSDSINLTHTSSLQLKNALGQPLTLHGIQGGEFSKSGHLFLFVQDGCNNSTEGIYVFDIKTGKLLNHQNEVRCTGSDQEFEGITIWDLDNNSNNGGFEGQVHALNYEDNFWYGKKFWLKHLRVVPTTEVITPEIAGSVQSGKPYLSWDNMGAGYSYEVYEDNSAPNGGISLYATTTNTNILIQRQLEAPGNGSYYNLRYYIRAKKNGLRSAISNKVNFSYEYVNEGGCGGFILC